MLPTQLEFEITQWLDGELPPDREAFLGRQLAENPLAAQWVAEHQRLNTLLEGMEAVPQVDWDSLRNRIAAHVREHGKSRRRVIRPWGELAIAACALLALGLGMRFAIFQTEQRPRAGGGIAIVRISGEQSPTAFPAAAVADVRIGPAAGVREIPVSADESDQWTDRVPRVIIAGGTQPAQDTMLVALAR